MGRPARRLRRHRASAESVDEKRQTRDVYRSKGKLLSCFSLCLNQQHVQALDLLHGPTGDTLEVSI
ncbi:hypothetical protein ABIF69_005871 [Bradyrhizobium japonicum]